VLRNLTTSKSKKDKQAIEKTNVQIDEYNEFIINVKEVNDLYKNFFAKPNHLDEDEEDGDGQGDE
jgi:hypothetical protein